MREGGSSLARLKAIFESVVFARHIFGMENLDECVRSRRCLGVTRSTDPKNTKQAPPLLVVHVKALHYILAEDPDPWNRAFCGMALFCIYAGGRWNDVQHCQSRQWDTDYSGVVRFVECSTATHKTCRSLSLKHSFLPLAAPASGVGAGNWAIEWKQVRALLEMDDLGRFPMLPAPDDDGKPTVSSSEAGNWLKMSLNQHSMVHGVPESLEYTSHSFKATSFSYLKKMGCSFDNRMALGYHADSIRMALRYSRDGAL